MQTRKTVTSHGPGVRLRFGLGLVGTLALVAMIWVGFNAPKSIPGRSYYTLKVQFANADNISAHSAVRMGGRLVGQALDPRVEDGHPVVDLQLKPDIGPLLSDTRVVVRPRSLVGVRYLDLVPGVSGRALPDGATLPPAQTRSPVGLDQVLDVLDPATRTRAQTLLAELGDGVLSRGDDVNDTLGDAPSMLTHLTDLSAALNQRPGAVGRLVTGAEAFTAALEPVRDDLAGGLRIEARALRPFSGHGAALRRTLERAPVTLRAAETELPVVVDLIDDVGGLGHDALPVLRALPAGLREATGLLVDSRPALRRLPRTLRRIDAATPATLAALTSVREALPAVDRFTGVTTPIARALAPRMCDIRAFAGHWANMNSWGDATSNYLRFDVFGADEETLFGATPALKELTDTVPATRVLQNPYPAPCTAGSEGGRPDQGGDPPDDGIPAEGVPLP